MTGRFADNTEFHASLPAEVPHRLPASALLEKRLYEERQLQDVRVCGDVVHSSDGVSKSSGKSKRFYLTRVAVTQK